MLGNTTTAVLFSRSFRGPENSPVGSRPTRPGRFKSTSATANIAMCSGPKLPSSFWAGSLAGWSRLFGWRPPVRRGPGPVTTSRMEGALGPRTTFGVNPASPLPMPSGLTLEIEPHDFRPGLSLPASVLGLRASWKTRPPVSCGPARPSFGSSREEPRQHVISDSSAPPGANGPAFGAGTSGATRLPPSFVLVGTVSAQQLGYPT